jgi:DNA primase
VAIPIEDIAKVRAATDIAALIGERTSLRKVGRRFVGLCPFHSEKTGSFSVNAEEGLYYCFGCQASGDAISFVIAIEGCDFVEAVERLAARAGVTVRNDADAGNEASRGRRPALYEALKKAADFYHERLLQDADAGPARQYLRSRGYDGETVRRFRIGFAPAKWDELAKTLRLPSEVAREAGLVFQNSQGRIQDTFRERVMFPIFDPGDRVIALGGRVLPDGLRRMKGEAGPKYRNSPESAVYQKRATLYGLNWSKPEMARTNEAIVCEGYTDVIGFFQAGLPRAVATCGTALTEDHFRLLSRFAKKVVLCFDADKAGENAAARLYEWERRHELELKVAALPPGSDPAELAQEAPEVLRHAIDSARPFLGFLLDRVLGAEELTSPEARARTAQGAIAVIAEHPSPLVRDLYLLEVADRTHHDLERLRGLLEEALRHPPERKSEVPRAPAPPPPSATEDEPPPRDEAGYEGGPPSGPGREVREALEARAGRDALVLAIHRPGEVAGRFREVLFIDPVQRRAFQVLSQANELHEAIDGADPETAGLLRRLAMIEEPGEIAIEGTLIELVRNATRIALLALDRDARIATLEGDDEALAAVSKESRLVKEELELLRDPDLQPGRPSAALEAAERLLAWLSSRELTR